MSESIEIPKNRYVEVRAYTNASYKQYVKLEFWYENSERPFDTWNFEGQGEYNKAMSGSSLNSCGVRWISSRSQRYTVKVSPEYEKNGRRNKHQTMPQHSTLGLYNIRQVVGEDDVDQDWNDVVIQFTWWSPPKNKRSNDEMGEESDSTDSGPPEES